ncbi:MAG: tetratricopeptide repeat protein [Myxococcales bacterium]|nr:tetratricopeptide repeat protein [Myxococcales bacterium]MCB9755293.1 tetratricopeptide repeat protein [Myxococcales bacterium]
MAQSILASDPKKLIGTVVARQYRLVELSGADPSSINFVGQRMQDGALVDVTVVRRELADDGVFAQRHIRNLRELSTLQQANLVKLLDYGNTDDGALFMITEHLDGEPMSGFLDRAVQLPWPEVRSLAVQCVIALRAAHARDVHHLAFRPTVCTLVIDDEGDILVKIRGFGLVHRRMSDSVAPTELLHYLSPEQVLGKPVDQRADIYAVGALMFRMLVGRPPLGGKMAQVAMQHKLASAPRLRGAGSTITPAIEALVQRALQTEPAARFESMGALQRAISEIGDHGFKAMSSGEGEAGWTTRVSAAAGEDEGDSAVFYSLDSLRGQLLDATDPRAQLELCVKMERAIDALSGPDADDSYSVTWRSRVAQARAKAYDALDDELRASRRWPELIELLLERLATLSDPEARVVALEAIAGIYTRDLRDPARAQAVYEEIVALDPERESALAELARLYLRADRPRDARAHIERFLALSRDPEARAELLVPLAKIELAERGDEAAAEHLLLKAIKLNPAEVDAALELAAIYKSRGDGGRLLSCLEHVVEHATSDYRKIEAASEAGFMLKDQHPERARALFEKVIALDPENVRVGTVLADMYSASGNLIDAAPIFDLLVRSADKLRLSPDSQLDLSLKAAKTWRALGKSDKALRMYQRALRLDGDHRGARLGEADALFELSRWADAYDRYRALLSPPPGGPPPTGKSKAAVYCRLAEIRSRQGDAKGAREYYEQALRADPRNSTAIEAMLVSRSAQGDVRGALRLREQALANAKGKERFVHLRAIGELYRDQLKDWRKAAEAFERAAELMPDDVGLLLALVAVYREQKHWKGVLRGLERLIHQEDNAAKRARYHYTAAVIYRDELGDTERALDRFDRVLNDDRTFLKAFQATDAIMTRRKDWKQLERAYRKMIKRLPADEEHALRSLLWANLGEIYRSRLGDYQSAAKAFEVATQVEPGNVARREILVELYEHLAESDPKFAGKAVRGHNSLLRVDPSRYRSYHYLFDHYWGSDQFDKAYCVARTLSFLKQATDEQLEVLMHVQRQGAAKIQRGLDLEGVRLAIVPPDQPQVLGRVLTLLCRAVSSWRAQAMPRSLWRRDRINLDTHGGARALCLRIVLRALGVATPAVYFLPEQPGDFTLINTKHEGQVFATITVQGGLMRIDDRNELLFAFARHCMEMYPPHFTFFALERSTGHLKELIYACMKLVGVDAPAAVNDAVVNELRTRLPASVVGQLQATLSQAGDAEGFADVKRWARCAQIAGYRAGLLLCDDLGTAARVIRQEERLIGGITAKEALTELILYSVSEQYFDARRRVGVNVD